MVKTATKKPTKQELLEKQIKELTEQVKMLSSLQSFNNMNVDVNGIKSTDRINVKTCRAGTMPYVLDGRELILNGLEDEISLSLNEASLLVSNQRYRSQLLDSTIYFTDDKWYEYFKITKPEILTEEYLISLLGKSNPIKELKELTKNKTKENMTNLLLYRIANLVKNNKVTLDYKKRTTIEKFFDVQLNSIITLINALNKQIAEAI